MLFQIAVSRLCARGTAPQAKSNAAHHRNVVQASYGVCSNKHALNSGEQTESEWTAPEAKPPEQ